MADNQSIEAGAVERAARWLADQPESPRPLVPTLRQRFGLTSREACESIAQAGRMRSAHAWGANIKRKGV